MAIVISACGSNPASNSANADEGTSTVSTISGESLYNRCKACHSIGKDGDNGIGPNLWGIVGANIGSKQGFTYSPALKNKGGVWDKASLNAFIESPQAFASGTRMSFAGIKNAQERQALIEYMAAQGE